MSHKRRSSYLGKVETRLSCAVCGNEMNGGAKYCSVACYRTAQRGGSDEARFWGKVNKGPNCWLWTGSVASEYGQFTITIGPRQQRHIGAHVYSYELEHGPVPDGLYVLHTCDTPLCIRPAHLFTGTHKRNMEDAAEKGRLHVPHPRRQRVTVEQLAQIDAWVAAGERQHVIATRLGVSETYVSLYLSGQRRQYDAPQPRLAKRSA